MDYVKPDTVIHDMHDHTGAWFIVRSRGNVIHADADWFPCDFLLDTPTRYPSVYVRGRWSL